MTTSSSRRYECSPSLDAPYPAVFAYRSTSSESTPLIQFEGKGYVDWQRKQSRRRRMSGAFLVCGCAIFIGLTVSMLLVGAVLPFLQRRGGAITTTTNNNNNKAASADTASSAISSSLQQGTAAMLDYVPLCDDAPCFRPQPIQVPTDRDGFPSYWNYAQPMNVSYDERSFFINSDRVLFLSGSMHPARSTLETWNYALDEAVRNGLNMITLYVIWSVHQPFPDMPFDWRLPNHLGCHEEEYYDDSYEDTGSCRWTLAGAIRAAANRGLFVHIRIGPFVCAEYSYGGIPEWLALKHPTMDMRRPNFEWVVAMQNYVTSTVEYLTSNRLWAYQGGPIVMGQIENELGGSVNTTTENLVDVDMGGSLMLLRKGIGDETSARTSSAGNATMQDYANWCGSIAKLVAPNVLWTMCYGLSAPNTIETFNGISGGKWLEQNGNSGRIQVDHPAMWTEHEGGFQIWGDEPKRPSDYFWGRTARAMVYSSLRWFARGGTHLNYYMWWGGYNMGRSSAAGISNMYAEEATLCPSGERRQPKFDHFEAFHGAIADIAPILLHAPSALMKNESVHHMNANGMWQVGMGQKLFRYSIGTGHKAREVVFVENNSNRVHVIKVYLLNETRKSVFEMQPRSAVVFVNGAMAFDSAALHPPSLSLTRKIMYDSVTMLDWKSWIEPIGPSWADPDTIIETVPIEQTQLMLRSSMSGDYAWFGTDFSLPDDLDSVVLSVSTQQANAIIVYVDNAYVGSNDTHHHKEGDVVLEITLGPINRGNHMLSILSESLGYHNLVGRWGGGTRAKTKGITGDVWLSSPQLDYNASLIDGRLWRSYGGLHGERLSPKKGVRRNDLQGGLPTQGTAGGIWSSARFDTPRYKSGMQALFLDISLGRGHIFLNEIDLGRFWNITRGNTSDYSQRYYFIPSDLLYLDGQLNELVIFDAFDGRGCRNYRRPRLAVSWVEPSDLHYFKDEVGFKLSCL